MALGSTKIGGRQSGRGGAVALSSGDQAAIEGVCTDLCMSAVSTRKSADAFEEELKAEICKIFIETVTQLRDGA